MIVQRLPERSTREEQRRQLLDGRNIATRTELWRQTREGGGHAWPLCWRNQGRSWALLLFGLLGFALLCGLGLLTSQKYASENGVTYKQAVSPGKDIL